MPGAPKTASPLSRSISVKRGARPVRLDDDYLNLSRLLARQHARCIPLADRCARRAGGWIAGVRFDRQCSVLVAETGVCREFVTSCVRKSCGPVRASDGRPVRVPRAAADKLHETFQSARQMAENDNARLTFAIRIAAGSARRERQRVG